MLAAENEPPYLALCEDYPPKCGYMSQYHIVTQYRGECVQLGDFQYSVSFIGRYIHIVFRHFTVGTHVTLIFTNIIA